MGKRVRINNDIQIEWTVNVQNSEGEYILDLSSLPLGVDLIVGTKVIHVEDFTVSGNIITFVFAGSQQTYTGSYVIKLYDTENSAITYDVVRAFVLVDHSWKAPDIISSPTVVTLSSTVNVYRIVTVKGEKGDGADGITAATVEKLGGIKLGYEQNGNNYPVMLDSEDRAYVTVEGGGGSGSGGSGGGSGGGGGTVTPRSVTSIDQWFKLSNEATGITSPALSIANPVDAGWNLVPGNPSEDIRFLWCFFQVNYDKPTAQGYSYTRTNASVVRRFNSDSSQEFDELERLIDQLREEMESDIGDFETDILDINTALQGLRTQLSDNIQTQLNGLDGRITQIEQTGTTPITGEGLWGMMTSYVDDGTEKGRKQKSFSDILLDAENAKATLDTGSRFFDREVSAQLTLNGIAGQINARVTQQYVDANFPSKQYVDNKIASAQIAIDPQSVMSAVSKGSLCWEKNDVLYRYDLHLDDQQEPFTDFADYEAFMVKSPAQGGPDDGPFVKKVILNEFSAIKQTAEEVASSVYKTIYMWQNSVGELLAYEDASLEDLYENRAAQYEEYTYDQYITFLGYTKVEVSNILTNITQEQNEISLRVADVNYLWRKNLYDGSFDYRRYFVPANKTRDQYVAEMQANGWTLYDFTPQMSVIDQTAAGVTMAVSKGTLCWVNTNINPSIRPDLYSVDYDYFLNDYNRVSPSIPYESWVPSANPGYQLKKINSAFSDLKLTSDQFNTEIAGKLSTSVFNQRADEFSFGISSSRYIWYNATSGDKQDYDFLWQAYRTSGSSLSYDDWVPQQQQGAGYVKTPVSLSGLTVKTDKIWAGVEKDGDLAASITILAECDTVIDQQGSRIILDADHVEVNGILAAGIVNAGFVNVERQLIIGKLNGSEPASTGKINGTIIDDHSITVDKLDVNSIIAGSVETGNNGLGTLIEAGTFALKYNGTTRAQFKVDTSGDIVLDMHSTSDNALHYSFGPNGFVSEAQVDSASLQGYVRNIMSRDSLTLGIFEDPTHGGAPVKLFEVSTGESSSEPVCKISSQTSGITPLTVSGNQGENAVRIPIGNLAVSTGEASIYGLTTTGGIAVGVGSGYTGSITILRNKSVYIGSNASFVLPSTASAGLVAGRIVEMIVTGNVNSSVSCSGVSIITVWNGSVTTYSSAVALAYGHSYKAFYDGSAWYITRSQ